MDCSQSCPVSKLEKLLLATDGSEFSKGAIREAISFAKKCSSKLYAIRVLETNPEYESIGSSIFEKEESEAATQLASIKDEASKEGVDCETIFMEGKGPAETIVDEAAERQIEMIVIGRRGRKGLAKLIMGGVAAKLIAHAPCKVLVVPRAAKIEFKTILVAVDGSAHSSAAASEAISIAKHCGSNIIAVSAIRDDSELDEAKSNVTQVLALGQKEGVSVETLTPVGRSYNVIVETAGGRGVDLIVMGTYGKTGLKKALMGSSTEKVVGSVGCAVLIVKA